jgi:hypothetical protein
LESETVQGIIHGTREARWIPRIKKPHQPGED